MPRNATNGTTLPASLVTSVAPAPALDAATLQVDDAPAPAHGRPRHRGDAKAYLTVDCQLPQGIDELLKKHADRTGVSPHDVIREILFRHVSQRPPAATADEMRVRLPERIYDPLCQQALRTGVSVRGLVHAIVLRHVSTARW